MSAFADDMSMISWQPMRVSSLAMRFCNVPFLYYAEWNGSSRRAYILLWFFFHSAALYIRDVSADRRETFTYDWKCWHLDIGGPKFGAFLQIIRGKLV